MEGGPFSSSGGLSQIPGARRERDGASGCGGPAEAVSSISGRNASFLRADRRWKPWDWF